MPEILNADQRAFGNVRPQDAVLTADGRTLYTTGVDGVLRAYEVATGALTYANTIGVQLGALDLSADGRFAFIAERVPLATFGGGGSGYPTYTVGLYRVDLATNGVSLYQRTTPAFDYTFNDVAALTNGTVLLTSNIYPGFSGGATTLSLDLANGAFSSVSGFFYLYTGGSITVGASHANALVGELNLSAASLYLYNANSGLIADHGYYENGVYGYAAGIEAYNEAAGLVAQFTGGRIHIYNGLLQYELDLTDLLPSLDQVAGLAFDATGAHLYVLDASANDIVEISTADWTVQQSFSLPDTTVFQASSYASELTVGPDAKFFIVMTSNRVLYVDNPSIEDRILGTPGNDVLTGTVDRDVIDGLAGADTMSGGRGDDTYVVDNLGDVVNELANQGYDRVRAQVNYTITAGSSVEALETFDPSSAAAVDLTGNDLANLVTGNEGRNTLAGQGGDDALLGAGGDDTLLGGAGNDRIVPGAGTDTADGGEGVDTLDLSSYAALVYIDLMAGQAFDGTATDALVSIENAVGTSLGDFLFGSAGANRLDGGAGGDRLLGEDGADTLLGGDGDDSIDPGAGADTADGGEGVDTLDLAGAATAYIVDLTAGATFDGVARDTLVSIENVRGTRFADTVFGSQTVANLIDGGPGSDYLFGGDDVGDTVTYAGLDRAVIIDLAAGLSFDGVDQDRLAGFETAIGTRFDDQIFAAAIHRADPGAGGRDTVVGAGAVVYDSSARGVIIDLAVQLTWDGVEHDTLRGVPGARGSRFDDRLFGSADANTLDGGAGYDDLYGGPGGDVFVLRRGEADGDIVRDFDAGGGDRLQLTGYGAGSTFARAAGNATLWAATDGETGAIDYIRVLGAVGEGDYVFTG